MTCKVEAVRQKLVEMSGTRNKHASPSRFFRLPNTVLIVALLTVLSFNFKSYGQSNPLQAELCSYESWIALGYELEEFSVISVENITGGTPGYSYSWSNDFATESITYVPDGTIKGDTNLVLSVTVSDANGGSVTLSHTVHVVDVRCDFRGKTSRARSSGRSPGLLRAR